MCASMLSAARLLVEAAVAGSPRTERHLVQHGHVRSFAARRARANLLHASVSCASPSRQLADRDLHALPDSHARLGSRYSACPGRHVERVVPCIQVAHRGDAIASPGRDRSPSARAGASSLYLAAPGAREADEELAILLPHVLRVVRAAAQCPTVGVEGRGRGPARSATFSTSVCLPSTCRPERDVARELMHQWRRGSLVAGHVRGRPPAGLATSWRRSPRRACRRNG